MLVCVVAHSRKVSISVWFHSCYHRGPPALLVLHLGNVAFRRWSAVELTIDYIRHQRLDDAVNLLCAMNFDVDGAACYSCLSAIVQHLLRQDLTIDSEGVCLQVVYECVSTYAARCDLFAMGSDAPNGFHGVGMLPSTARFPLCK